MLLLPNVADPHLTRSGNTFLLTTTEADKIYLRRSHNVPGLATVERKLLIDPHMDNVWSAKMSYFGGRFFVTFTAGDGGEGQRIYYCSATAAVGPYNDPVKLELSPDRWAIDATLTWYNNKAYCAWSGAESSDATQMLYITELIASDKLTVVENAILIAAPTHDWEKQTAPILEGPEFLRSGTGPLYLTYSASAAWSPSYCSGILRLDGVFPLVSRDWTKNPLPLHASDPPGRKAPGHLTFAKEQLSDQWWACWHQARDGSGLENRDTHCQRFFWQPGIF